MRAASRLGGLALVCALGACKSHAAAAGRPRGSAGGGALDRRRQPRSGAHQRSRVAGGGRAGVRTPGPILAGAARAGARSGDQLVGQRRRHRLDVRAAPEHAVSGRDAGRCGGGGLLDRATDRPRAPAPRARLRLDARLPQHPPRARRRPAARAVRDRSPLRAVPGQPGDGAGGDRLADGGEEVGARLRAPPGRLGALPLRRVDPGRSHHARAQPDLLGSAGAHPLPRPSGHARFEAAAAGAGVGRRRRDPAAGARRSAARAPASGSPAGDGAGGAGLVPGDEHAATAAQRSAHSPGDRPRHPHRGAGEAGLPGARHPGDRPACRPTSGGRAPTS